MEADINDIYIPVSGMGPSTAYPGPRSINPTSVQGSDVADLLEAARAEASDVARPFRVEHKGSRWRAQYIDSVDGKILKMRRMAASVPSLRECGFTQEQRNLLSHQKLAAGGLVLVCGLPGSGKSTTAAALLKSWLMDFGGMAMTVEDPAEHCLQGIHERGMCIQREVAGEDEFASALRESLRCYPSNASTLLLIGEVRDPVTAALALQAAADGRLVVSTVHGASIEDTLARMRSLAEGVLSHAAAKQLLASGFRLGIHQRIDADTKFKLKATLLAKTDEINGALLSDDGLAALRSEIQKQQKALSTRQPIWT